ncbi:MAG: sulfurtransferase TusA family protein [Fibrobacter sp.]|jgi:TusA-related sulfurtransferase|nr:sulfurtransferase TusA family protein [Fibrobacter sp.]
MDERNSGEPSTVFKWMLSHRDDAGFGDALKSLISYACVEWLRVTFGVQLAPEDALSRVMLADLPAYPVGRWLEHPERHCEEIAAFCEKAKSGEPLPGVTVDVPDVLDLRGVVCPGNAARSRLVMSGYPRGRVLKIDLDEGSPIENVPGALVADGCSIVSREKKDGFWEISVVKPLDSK